MCLLFFPDAFRKIIDEEGVQTLWSGTVSSLALVINPALHFMVYEFLKRYYSRLTKGAVSIVVTPV